MDFFSVGQWTCKTLKNEEKKTGPESEDANPVLHTFFTGEAKTDCFLGNQTLIIMSLSKARIPRSKG